MAFESGDVLGSYRLLRPIGIGGMGRVFEAEHLALGVRRALKVFECESAHADFLRKRFLAEGRTLAVLDHPRVVKVHDLAVDPATETPYFAMDLILSPSGEPRTLEDERNAGLDEERVLGWVRDVCEGLDAVHRHGVVHRDIKAENVLIGPDGRAVLSDFGISRIFDDGLRKRLGVTMTMPLDAASALRLGTERYMAPELGRGEAEASPETDAWALGVLVFRLLTGFWFEAENRARCLKLLDDYDLDWRRLVSRLCAEDPSSRRDPSGLMRLLDGGLARSCGEHGEAGVRERGGGRGWLLAASLALVCGLAIVAAFVLPRPSDEEAQSRRQASFAGYDAELCAGDLPGADRALSRLLNDFIVRSREGSAGPSSLSPDALDRCANVVDWAESCPAILAQRGMAARLLALSDEILRRRLESDPGADVSSDRQRKLRLVRKFVAENADNHGNSDWVLEMLRRTGLDVSVEAYQSVAGDSILRSRVAPGLLESWLRRIKER